MVGPVGPPVVEGGRHVATHRVFPELLDVHGVEHLGRDEHGHGGPLIVIPLNARSQAVGQVMAQRRLELLQVLDGVLALPDRALPLLRSHIPVAGQTSPVGLHELKGRRVGNGLAADATVR